MKILSLSLIIFSFYSITQAQQMTLTISTGPDWEDAVVFRDTRSGYENKAGTNYNNDTRLAVTAWTASGQPNYRRTLLRFNLAAIPTGSTIQSASLYFYSDPTITSPNAWNGNSNLSGSNAFYLEKITQAWITTTVTWNNQPYTTTTDRAWVGPSLSPTENITANITPFIQGWVDNPGSNQGLKMTLENELHYRARNYASTNHTNSSIHPKLVIHYTLPTVSDPVRAKLDSVFQYIDKSQVPTGYLEEYGATLLPFEAFNGVLSDSNRFNMTAWRMAYGSFYTSKIYGSQMLPALDQVNAALNISTTNTTTPVALLYGNYNYLDPEAVNDNLLDAVNEQLYDVPGRSRSPYLSGTIFAASPVRNYSSDGNLNLLFKPGHFYNTGNKTIANIAVDFDKGEGYLNAGWDVPLSATYLTTGTKHIKIKLTFTDGTIVECTADMEVQRSGANALYAYSPDFDQSFNATSNHSGGKIFVRYDRNNAERTIDKPLIVVEGYDVSSIAKDLQTNYTYENFIDALNETNTYNFNFQLDNIAGYDLIFLDYNNGTDDIRRNAELLEDVIVWVNQQKTTVRSTEPNVVMGISMGGLVARYALAEMTKANNDPKTRLLITHDSPHRGANTPLGLQFLTRATANVTVIDLLNLLDVIPQIEQAEDILDATATKQMLIVRATNDSGGAVSNTFLDGDYRNMITFAANDPQPGYELVATSLGSECGHDILAPYTELVRVTGKFFYSPIPWLFNRSWNTEIIINALPELGPSKRIMKLRVWIKQKILFFSYNRNLTNKSANSPANILPWDGVPGGTQNVEEQASSKVPTVNFKLLWFIEATLNSSFAGDFCFVPTVSALDIVNINQAALNDEYTWGISPGNPSRVDNFIAQEQVSGNVFNEMHPRFTARNAEWLFKVIENVPNNTLNCTATCTPDGFEVSGPDQICTSETYQINDLPAGTTVNWTYSGGISGPSTGNPITVTSTSNVNATISASISNTCGTINTTPKPIDVGATPVIPLLLSPSGSIANSSDPTNIYYDVCISSSNDNIHIDLAGVQNLQAFNYSSGSYPTVVNTSVYWTFPSGSYSGTLRLEYDVDCGHIVQFVMFQNTCSGYYRISPNPAASELVVEIEDDITNEFILTDSNENEGIELKLYNKTGEMVLIKNSKKQKTILNTRTLPDGLYYLHIIDGDGRSVKKHIILEH